MRSSLALGKLEYTEIAVELSTAPRMSPMAVAFLRQSAEDQRLGVQRAGI